VGQDHTRTDVEASHTRHADLECLTTMA
jgi:hypothetical protein